MLKLYGGSISKAIKSIYPNISIQKKKPNGYWENINNQIDWFENLAKENGINPSTPEQWSLFKDRRKYRMSFMNLHQGSFLKTLASAYSQKQGQPTKWNFWTFDSVPRKLSGRGKRGFLSTAGLSNTLCN